MQVNSIKTGFSPEFDQLFVERYESILRWALQITKYDHALAEDLAQDVYMRFKVNCQDVEKINSLDSYLYVALRNSYVSYRRQTSRQRTEQLPIVEFESAGNVLLAIDPRKQLAIREDLRTICEYACRRKSTSISGSILILRFFHGYFPSEVARILKSSRNVVEARLLSARREVALYLENPDALNVVLSDPIPKLLLTNNYVRDYQNILEDLQKTVFASSEYECFEADEIKYIYFTRKVKVTRKVLSHFVSCPTCLETVNKLLQLPKLAERHPLDVLGKEKQNPIEQMMVASENFCVAKA